LTSPLNGIALRVSMKSSRKQKGQDFKSTHKIASTAKLVTSKTPPKTSTGLFQRVPAGQITATCKAQAQRAADILARR